MTYTLWPTTGTSSVPNEVLVKEDVTNEITNLFPLHSPLHQWLGRKPMSTVHQEQPVDTIGNITRTNAAIALGSDATVRTSGSDASYVTELYPHKLRGVCQLQHDAWAVSGTDRKAEMWGISDRFTHEGIKVSKKLLQDFELRGFWARGTSPSGNTVNRTTGALSAGNNARQTQGIGSWILTGGLERGKGLTNTIYNTHGEILRSSASLDYRTHAYDAQGLQFDEQMWSQSLMNPWYDLAADVTKTNVAFMGSKPKFAFRTFALSVIGAINQRTIPAASKRIIDTVEVYETDFGVTYLHLNYYMNKAETTTYTLSDSASVVVPWDETILVINPQYYKIGEFRAMEYQPLAKTGDADKGQYVMEKGILCLHPFGGAGLVNCIAA